MTPQPVLTLACWLSDKKAQKLDWQEFEAVSNKHGYKLFNVRLPNTDLFNPTYIDCIFR